MTEEAHRLIKTIKQMEASLEDNKKSPKYKNGEPQVTYPLTRCLKALKEKYNAVQKMHQERFKQVQSTSHHLQPSNPC
jgi:protein regulator of cytokinesis 1